jgi:hypothetical protein
MRNTSGTVPGSSCSEPPPPNSGICGNPGWKYDRQLNRITLIGTAHPAQNEARRKIGGSAASPSVSTSGRGTSVRGNTRRSFSIHWRRRMTTRQKHVT